MSADNSAEDVGRMPDTQAAHMTAQCGTAEWMAPELCDAMLERHCKHMAVRTDPRGREDALKSFYVTRDKPVEYSQKVDVYAFGIVLHEILTHEAPWQSTGSEGGINAVYTKVAAGERPTVNASRQAAMPGWCGLMEACWHHDASRRPTFEAATESLEESLVRMRDEAHKQL